MMDGVVPDLPISMNPPGIAHLNDDLVFIIAVRESFLCLARHKRRTMGWGVIFLFFDKLLGILLLVLRLFRNTRLSRCGGSFCPCDISLCCACQFLQAVEQIPFRF